MSRAGRSAGRSASGSGQDAATVDLSAVIVAAYPDGPLVLLRQIGGDLLPSLPSGPLEPALHTHSDTLCAALLALRITEAGGTSRVALRIFKGV